MPPAEETITEPNLRRVLRAYGKGHSVRSPLQSLALVRQWKSGGRLPAPPVSEADLGEWLETEVGAELKRWQILVGVQEETAGFGQDCQQADQGISDVDGNTLKQVSAVYYHYIRGIPSADLGKELGKRGRTGRTVEKLVSEGVKHFVKKLRMLESSTQDVQSSQLSAHMRERLPTIRTDLIDMEEEKRKLRGFIEDRKVTVISVFGPPGTGKSSLVLHLTDRLIKEFWPSDLAWVDMAVPPVRLVADWSTQNSSGGKLPDPFLTAADQLLSTVTEDSAALEHELRKKCLTEPCLIVVNNLEPGHDSGPVERLCACVGPPSKLILTTIDRWPDAFPVRMTGLPPEKVREYLSYYAHREEIDLHAMADRQVDELARATGCNPWTLKRVLHDLRYFSVDEVVEDLVSRPALQVQEYLCLRQWNMLEPDSRRIMSLLVANYPPAGLSRRAALELAESPGGDAQSGLKAIRRLADLGLLEFKPRQASGDGDDRAVLIHPIVRHFVSDLRHSALSDEGQRGEGTTAVKP